MDSAKGEIVIMKQSNHELAYAFISEAMRVVSQMPRWKPGKRKSKNVRTRMSLPINFRLV